MAWTKKNLCLLCVKSTACSCKPVPKSFSTFFLTEATVADLEAHARQTFGIKDIQYGRFKRIAEDVNKGLAFARGRGFRMPTGVQIGAGKGIRMAGLYSVSNDAMWFNGLLPGLSGRRPMLVSDHPCAIVIHEFGHMLHSDKVGGRYDNLKNHQFRGDTEKEIIATVGKYAASNGLEFVAEVFSGMVCDHRQFSDIVMRQYRILDGPDV